MSTEDPTRPRLRVGRWIPPYRDASRPADAGLPAGHWAETAVVSRIDGPGLVRPRPRYIYPLAFAVVAVVAFAGVAALLLRTPRPPSAAPPRALLPAVSFEPPVPVLPAVVDPSDPSGSADDRPATRRPPLPHADTGADTPAGRVSTAPGSARTVDLIAGTTIGLEVSDRPGFRVRHRNFLGRVDRIGPGSSSLDRADSRFTVRAGLAGKGCFSFEAVNYPQQFLRHQNFVIHLQRRDGTALFAADATFCPVPRPQGAAFSLRAYNYPGRYVTEANSQLSLTPATATDATAYLVRPPV
jgi:Alpha-L-arabinofuranosidase B (ABFB) domain